MLTLVYSASSATIVRFPYLHSLVDAEDYLYSTADVAMWSTTETGLGITAACVATLRPLLKSWFNTGSSAPGHGTSARHYKRTGSGHPGTREDGFDMHDRTSKGIGVTTVIDHGLNKERDIEAGGVKSDNRSETSDPFAGNEDWNSSQSNLAESSPQGGWAGIRVQQSVVQTTSHA